DDFHARYLATKKEYRYYILKEKVPDVFKRNYVYQYTGQLDREAMRKACAYFIGEHDFTTFSSAKSTVKGMKIRTIDKLDLKEKIPDVFKRNYVYQYTGQLDREAMRKACAYFIGEHDFTTFSSDKSTVKGSKIRTIEQLEFKEEGNYIILIFKGNGFLYQMVRIIAEFILDVGRGKYSPENIPDLFKQKNRSAIGRTLTSKGLYLWEVSY